MYRIWFTFRNDVGGRVRDFLDNNGKGLRPMDALYVANELKAQDKTHINIVRIDSLADKQEMERWFGI